MAVTADSVALHSIYVASSWRNERQLRVVEALRARGHRVYDFKRPGVGGERGFHWSDEGLGGAAGGDTVEAAAYLAALSRPAVIRGFNHNLYAMQTADTLVLVLPSDRSAHQALGWAVLGWAVGVGKRTAILLDDPCTPELMDLMVDHITTSLQDLVWWAESPGSAP